MDTVISQSEVQNRVARIRRICGERYWNSPVSRFKKDFGIDLPGIRDHDFETRTSQIEAEIRNGNRLKKK